MSDWVVMGKTAVATSTNSVAIGYGAPYRTPLQRLYIAVLKRGEKILKCQRKGDEVYIELTPGMWKHTIVLEPK